MATELTLPMSCDEGVYWNREADQELVCIDVRQETHDVKTFTFRARDDRYFSFDAGQYFLFELEIDGEMVSRCYSLASSALTPRSISITVKRVEGGKVSNWLHDHLKPGSAVRGTGPSGTFTLPGPAEGPYLLVSGGSGITPVMSMVRALADARRHPDIVFLHAARTPADLVFRDELLYRAKVTPNFRLLFLPERAGGEPGYAGVTGRVSEAFLKVAVPDLAERTVMCCGPAPFMGAVRQLSLALGVKPERYFEESFDAAVIDEDDVPLPPAAEAASTFKVKFAKQDKVIEVGAEQSVLAAARKSGVRLPSSCSNGLCGTCKSKLVSGSVDMKHNGGIRQREVDAGFFLPCCSKPLSDLVVDR
ncbi:hybrid-cluster NAD(P)-dependent oxidoreductase [Azohydromonas australica]|uniref:hybrid-cluster NAD(P)-dependent oxidoreductase n=1 Tax=Azohydromonas australica TaxID=364039 RepID=UPI000408FAED|nr:hybrid-cluster NAD(P)-dependent oxidoreductase [Azohydromonas australica]